MHLRSILGQFGELNATLGHTGSMIGPMGMVKSFILKYTLGSDCKYTILSCSILSGIEPQGVWKNTKF